MGTLTNNLWLTELKVLYLDDFTSVVAIKKLLNPGWFSLLVVASGTINFTDGSSSTSLSAGAMCTIPSTAEVTAIKKPLRICMLSCTMDFAITNRVTRFGVGYFEALTNQSAIELSLSKAEMSYVIQLFAMLKKNVDNRHAIFQDEMVLLCINLIFYVFNELYYKYSRKVTTAYDRNEHIVMLFIKLVQECCRVHHDVKFYADSLFVSNGHLRKIIRGQMGMSAKHFIEMAIITEAYALLATDILSITEIGEQLNFSSSSSFSGFFKRHTKLSPTQYRQNLKF